MLKKAGIVAVAATAGIFALTPLAFALDRDDRGDGDDNTSFVIEDNSVERNQVNRCDFEQNSAATGLLGPILSQSQQGNCVNVGDGSSLGPPPPPPPGPGPDSEVVYSSIPDNLPGHVISISYNATGTSELGDEVGLAGGPDRELESLEVVLDSSACQVGNFYSNNCVTTPGATFAHPITMNVYAVDDSGPTPTPGALLATRTEVSSIPYRPSADPVNCTGANAGQWFDPSDDACYSGISFSLRFEFPAGTPLPDRVIWTVAFNTTNAGPNPIGPAPCVATVDGCTYDSLNLGADTFAGAPYVGVDIDPNGAFLDSNQPGFYCDGGAGGTGFLRLDTDTTSCWDTNKPLGKITALVE
ncbi:hypothetical protein ACQPWY_28715 [Pseudonocardia xinjiangensis]|uniref:hypothetical protein n=1 Tax=Pseudonocardia xinjiangensis TaxID=75289 RepID=UPI003D9288A7